MALDGIKPLHPVKPLDRSGEQERRAPERRREEKPKRKPPAADPPEHEIDDYV